MRLERITYVHDGDPGAVGQLISESRGALRFGGEGSGLIEIERAAPAGGSNGGPDLGVRVIAVKFSSLAPEVQREIGEEQVPCILGHSGVETRVLLARKSLGRVTGGLNDLRGKIRFALARIGWEL